MKQNNNTNQQDKPEGLGQVDAVVMQLSEHIEELSAEVHNAWWAEKRKQGFHSPMAHSAEQSIKNQFEKICDKCHPDMYPYNELPENIKEYDRVTVRSVLNAIKKVV